MIVQTASEREGPAEPLIGDGKIYQVRLLMDKGTETVEFVKQGVQCQLNKSFINIVTMYRENIKGSTEKQLSNKKNCYCYNIVSQSNVQIKN